MIWAKHVPQGKKIIPRNPAQDRGGRQRGFAHVFLTHVDILNLPPLQANWQWFLHMSDVTRRSKSVYHPISPKMHNWSHFYFLIFSLIFFKKCFLPLVFISLTHVELFPSGKLGKSPGTMETQPKGNTISYLLVLALGFLYLSGGCGDGYSLLVVILLFKGKANADISAWMWNTDMQPNKLGLAVLRSKLWNCLWWLEISIEKRMQSGSFLTEHPHWGPNVGKYCSLIEDWGWRIHN